VDGSTPFSIRKSENFKHSFKKLAKTQGENFVELVAKILDDLTQDPYPIKSRQEPLPRKVQLPEGWTFRKLEFWLSKGAAGQIRLMYLVNTTDCTITPLWIYSHDQFEKRPPDRDINRAIAEMLDS